MTTRRWMKKILAEAKKEQIDLPWARAKRVQRRTVKAARLRAAE